MNGLVKRWMHFTKVFTWMLKLHLAACRFALSALIFHLWAGTQSIPDVLGSDSFFRVPRQLPKSSALNFYSKWPQELLEVDCWSTRQWPPLNPWLVPRDSGWLTQWPLSHCLRLNSLLTHHREFCFTMLTSTPKQFLKNSEGGRNWNHWSCDL